MLKLIILILFSASCATGGGDYKPQLNILTLEVESSQKRLSSNEFRKYLTKMLGQKNDHLVALRSQYEEAEKYEIQHQDSSSIPSDIQQMNLRSSQIQLHNLDKEIKDLEKQVFYLKSKLSSI